MLVLDAVLVQRFMNTELSKDKSGIHSDLEYSAEQLQTHYMFIIVFYRPHKIKFITKKRGTLIVRKKVLHGILQSVNLVRATTSHSFTLTGTEKSPQGIDLQY